MDEETYIPTDYSATVTSLESKYANQGLKFIIPFSGMIPVQAYGELKGMRFYFRFRSDSGSLKLGIYNSKVEDQYYEEQEKFRAARYSKLNQEYASGDLSKKDYELNILLDRKATKAEATGDYYPNPILIEAWVDDYTGEPYEGCLTPEQAEDLFNKLMEQL